jgi:hypothetical protein
MAHCSKLNTYSWILLHRSIVVQKVSEARGPRACNSGESFSFAVFTADVSRKDKGGMAIQSIRKDGLKLQDLSNLFGTLDCRDEPNKKSSLSTIRRTKPDKIQKKTSHCASLSS